MSKIYLYIILLLGPSVVLAQSAKDLSPLSFSANIKEARNIQLVDVRTPGEFNEGHIKNAENIDFNDRRFLREINSLEKDIPTYIYCRSGGRSSRAMETMLNEGFTKVYNLDGGILAWRDAKLPITKAVGSGKGMTLKEFKKIVTQDVPVLVDFTATWCGPCKIMKPNLVRLADNYSNELKVIYIDVDENKDLTNEVGIQAMPTLHLYKKGKLARKQVGLISYKELKRFIR